MALFVVYVDANVLNLLTVGDVKDFVNFMLDRESVRIPSEHARDRMAGMVGKASHGVLNCARQDVAVVREAGGESGSIKQNGFG
jgi:hypothetical protein